MRFDSCRTIKLLVANPMVVLHNHRWISGSHPGLFFAVVIAVVLATGMIGLRNVGAQQVPAADDIEVDEGGSAPDDLSAQGVQQLIAEFEEFLIRRERIFERSQQLQQNIRQSEANWGRVKWEEARQFGMMMEAVQQTAQLDSMSSEQIAAYRGTFLAYAVPPPFTPQSAPVIVRGADAHNLERALQEMNARLGQAQLQQLDAVSRSIILQRLTAIREMVDLHRRLTLWNTEYWGFAPRYWPHSDPEQKFTLEEIELRLEYLEVARPEDHFAKFTKGLLLQRQGNHGSAIREFEALVAGPTSLAGPATLAKAISVSANGDDKEAKRLIPIASKSKLGLPMENWLLARLFTSQGNVRAAEKELRNLIANPSMELMARRELVLLNYQRSQGNRKLIDANLKAAQIAFDLDPAPDWYANLVYALAQGAKQNYQESTDLMREAIGMAEGENKELCETILGEMENEQWIDWKPIRKAGVKSREF